MAKIEFVGWVGNRKFWFCGGRLIVIVCMQICFCSAEKRRAYCIGTGKYVAYLNILFCLNYYFVFITCFVHVDEQLIIIGAR